MNLITISFYRHNLSRLVGWVEQRETHRNIAQWWVSLSLYPSYTYFIYKLDECRTRCYVLVDALALIHPTWLSKALIGHTGQVATCPYIVSKQQPLDKGSAAKVMYNDERSAW